MRTEKNMNQCVIGAQVASVCQQRAVNQNQQHQRERQQPQTERFNLGRIVVSRLGLVFGRDRLEPIVQRAQAVAWIVVWIVFWIVFWLEGRSCGWVHDIQLESQPKTSTLACGAILITGCC